MSRTDVVIKDIRIKEIRRALAHTDLQALTAATTGLTPSQIVDTFQRLHRTQRAVLYRLLPKEQAVAVFERLAPALQRDLVRGLQDEDVVAAFGDLDPDDRAELLDELPATVARKLMQGLSVKERGLTADLLGYPKGSIGRRMSPEFVAIVPNQSAAEALQKVTQHLDDAETVYTLPVVDENRVLVGVVSLRELLKAPADALVAGILQPPHWARATDDSEYAARHCADLKLLALPVVDNDTRLVGILTVDDALAILEAADSEDQAHIGGSEPLHQPYLTTGVATLVRSRVVWLLVLAIGATLTVQVLEIFEATLAEVVTLALFVPLLIGTGGNTGNQAATTVTRALALRDVTSRDVVKVLAQEFRVGLSLGLILGSIALVVTSLIYDLSLGLVIGLTLLSVCTLAATVGGAMPLIAGALRADPAVFSNPFISTFVDASGLIIYFLIAKAILGI